MKIATIIIWILPAAVQADVRALKKKMMMGKGKGKGGGKHLRQVKPFTFAVLGDGPYGEQYEPEYDNMIHDVNADNEVEFAIHAGDIKGGGEVCTDEFWYVSIGRNTMF
jgi:hypothetical protein